MSAHADTHADTQSILVFHPANVLFAVCAVSVFVHTLAATCARESWGLCTTVCDVARICLCVSATLRVSVCM